MKLSFIMLIFAVCSLGAQSTATNVYLIPGQGSDYRIYEEFDLGHEYILNHIDYVIPSKNQSMSSYAAELSKQINTKEPFILIGVSLGGMLCTELTEILEPEKTIIISSAKSFQELPGRYRFQKHIPIYKLFLPLSIKWGAQIAQPLVEPDRKNNKETFKSMLKAKDKHLMKRTVGMIMSWDRLEYPEGIIHIHGDNDKTLPSKNVKYDVLVENGSHMMTLTEGEKINRLVLDILNQ